MADEQIVTNIVANADFSNLIGDLNKVTAALGRMQAGLKSTDRALANQIRAINTQFGDTLRSTGQFTSHFVTIASDVDKFGKSLDSGKMKLGQYFKVWQEHHRTAGGLIRDLAKQQVQMQNAVLQPLGKNAEGMMRFAVHVPRGLDEIRNKTALTRQELAIMNKVVQDGAGQLINWGKNTQWAGRQLTVGLTVPLVAFGKASADAFKAADEQLVRLTKVYGDLGGASAETLARVRKDVADTARELSTTMGVNFKDTIALAADIAATGKTGNELLGSISETTRLAVLGEVDRQEAMKATLAIQSTFKQNTEQLAESINFLNAVENQTSTTLNDLVEAIPRAGTVIQGLGGSVQDLALYLTAMREGGVNATEGANALKSALGSLINPTKVALGLFSDFGIDLKSIVTENAGNLTKTILSLQSALETLDPLQKQQALEQLFGKFQFARLNALFANLGKQGSQTLQILDLMKASSEDLANIAGRELAQVTESASGKYKRAVETLKADLARTGEQFLGIATKVVNALDKIVNFINDLPEPIKKIFGLAGAFTAVVGPVIMLTGVLGNFFGYIVKGIYHFKALFKGAEGWKLLTPEIMAANNAASLIEKTFYSDAQAANILQKAILDLTAQYDALATAAGRAAVGTGSVSTVAGNPIVAGGLSREVDPKHPLAGNYQSRAFAHMVPRKTQQPGTIFGVTPSSGPVNSLIGENPMIYAEGDMPIIPGLTAIERTVKTPAGRVPMTVSTGVVAEEVARNHAMMAALAMQSKDELKIIQDTLENTGMLSTEFMGTFDDILPVTTRLAQKAANESAQIVAQVQAGKMSVEAARARIIELNILIEQEMVRDVSALAAARGVAFDPYTVPTSTQPAVDPVTGKTNMKELFHKKEKRTFLQRIGDRLRVRTSGAGYNIATTRPIRRQAGGIIPYTLNDGPVIPGPSSDTTDTQFGMLPAGTFIVNKGATANNFEFLSSLVGGGTPMVDGGQLQPVMLTPEEFAVPPSIVNQGDNLRTLQDINSGRIIMRRTGGIIPMLNKGGRDWEARQFAHLDDGAKTAGLSQAEKERLAQMFGINVADLDNPRTSVKSGFYAEYHKFFNQESNKGRLPIDAAIDYLSGKFIAVDSDGNYNPRGKKRIVHDPLIAYSGIMDDLGIPADRRASFAADLDAEIISELNKAKSSGKSILADRIAGANKDAKVQASIIGEAVSNVARRAGLSRALDVIKEPAEIRVPQTKPDDGVKRTRGVSTNRFFRTEESRAAAGRAAKKAGRRMPVFTGLARMAIGRNSGGIIPGFVRGGHFFGKIRSFAGRKRDEQILNEISTRVSSSRFRNVVPIDPGHLISPSTGHSFPVAGIGGVYRTPDGSLVFRKPVMDEAAALAEIRAMTIARDVHGLDAPRGRIRVIKDPTDFSGKRSILTVESPYDPQFAKGGQGFTREQMVRQLVASLIRGDKDLSPDNVYGNVLADTGTSGVFTTASGKRFLGKKIKPVSDQADINLLHVKGRARKWFAKSTAALAAEMTPGQYGSAIRDEFARVIPRLKSAISTFNLTPYEKKVYEDMIKRAEEGLGVNWSSFHSKHVSAQNKKMGGKIRGYNAGGLVPGGKKVPGMQYKNLGGVLRAIWSTITGALKGRSAAGSTVKQAPKGSPFDIPFIAPGQTVATPPVIPVVAANAADDAGMSSAFGFKGQMLGMAGSVAGAAVGSKYGMLGSMIGGNIGYMAMFLPQLVRAAKVAGGLAKILKSLTIPGAIITALIGIGKYLFDLKKKYEDVGKANRLAFGGSKESFESVGIKTYKTMSDRIKSINDELELHRAKVKSVYESYTKTGVTGLSLTIEQLREAIKKAKKEQTEYVEAFNTIDSSKVVQYAAQLKAQFVAMGMSAQDATNQIYAIVKASNKAGQAFSAITSSDFTSIQTSLDGIKFVVDYLSKSTGSTFNVEEFNVGLETLLNSILNYKQSLIGVKDEQGNIRDEADATAETLEKISKIQGAQAKLNEEQLDSLKSQNIIYAGILGNAETLESISAKILLYTGGLAEVVNLGAMSADAAISLAKSFADVQNIMNSVTEDTNTADKFRNSISPLSVQIERIKNEATNAASAVKRLKKVDEDYYREKMKAIDKLIAKLQKERDERLKLIDLQERASTFENQIQSAQIKYQQALTAGNMAQAAQEQLNINQLSSDRQRQLLRDSINEKYNDEIEKLQEQKDKLQEELDNANKNYAAKTAAATEKAAELARLQSYRDELEMIALRNIDKPISSTDSNRIENIFKEMTDSGGYLREVASQMRASNPASAGRYVGSTFTPGKSFSQTLVDNLNADLKSRASENNTFAAAVKDFVAAVNKFAGGTSPDYRNPGKAEKNEKGFFGKAAALLGASGETPFDTSIMVIKNPKTGAEYYIPLDSPRFKDAYVDITNKGYHFVDWRKDLPNNYSESQVYMDTNKIPKAAYGKHIKGYSKGTTDGPISGPGTPTSDSIIVRVSDGEFVTRASSVSEIGSDNMHLINQKGSKGIVQAAMNILSGKSKGGKISQEELARTNKSLSYYNPAIDNKVSGFSSLMANVFAKSPFGATLPAAHIMVDVLGTWLTGRKTTFGKRGFAKDLNPSTYIPYLTAFNQSMLQPFAEIAKGSGTKGDWLNAATLFVPSPSKISSVPSIAKGIRSASKVEDMVPALSMISKQKYKAVLDSIYKRKNIEIDKNIYPTYTLGNRDNQFAFQGYGEDLSPLLSRGVGVVPTTPEGILREALRLNPGDKNLTSLLDNFSSKNFGKSENEFLDRMTAAISVGKRGKASYSERTDGFAIFLASLAGDANAKRIIDERTANFYKIIEAKEKTRKADAAASSARFGSAVDEVDPTKVPAIHSTKYPVTRDKDGSISLYPYGQHTVGTDKAVPRASIHFTLEAPVESHIFGQWDAAQNKIVSPLSSMIDENNLPYNLNSIDTWWMRSPGQPLKISNASVIRPFTDSTIFQEELIKRGLLEPGKMPPVIVVDPKTKDVLHMIRPSYSAVDRLQIARASNDLSISPFEPIPGSGKKIYPDDPKSFVGHETELLNIIAMQLAKKQLGITSSPTKIDGWGLANKYKQDHVNALNAKYGIPGGIHSQSGPEMLESAMNASRGITDETKFFGDSIEGIRMAALMGRFKTNIEKIRDPFDDFAMGGYINKYPMGGLIPYASGGYIRKFHTLRGEVPGPYGQEVGAVLRAKTESVYPTDYIDSLKNATMSGGNTYVLNNEINAAEGMDINQLADVVTRKTVDAIKTINSQTNKSIGEPRRRGSMVS